MEKLELKRKRILIVEDDGDQALILKIQLEGKGFQVHTETLGATAISYAVRHPCDLVILDLRLPDISGLQVSKELRRFYCRWDLPILILTALSEPVDQLRGFAHGADAYLTKPCDPAELFKAIHTLL